MTSDMLLSKSQTATGHPLSFFSIWTPGNWMSKKGCFQLLWVGEILDMLGGAKWFSTPDLKSIYWQMTLHLDNKNILNSWQVKSYGSSGLWNTPATFKWLMETILRGLISHISCTWTTWSWFQRARVEPVNSVPAVLRSPPKAQSREVLILSEGRTVPRVFCITCGGNHRPQEAESQMGMADLKNKHEIRSFLGLYT